MVSMSSFSPAKHLVEVAMTLDDANIKNSTLIADRRAQLRRIIW
jgi:hypothetical protein